MSKKYKPPAPEIFYDEYEEKASRLYEKFSKDKKPAELLLRASEEIAKSSNPDAEKISILYNAWYLREKGIAEKDNAKARKLLLKAIDGFKKVVPKDDVILKRLEIEFLKRKIISRGKKPEFKLFLRRARLFEELGDVAQYNQDMCLYYMFQLTNDLRGIDDDQLLNLSNLMLDHAKKGSNEEMKLKIQGLYHQLRANLEYLPKEKLKHLEKAAEAIKETSDRYGEGITDTEISMAKAMTTINAAKRNKLLEKVVKDYKKRGLTKREEFVRSLMSPLPIKASEVVYLSDKSEEKINAIEKKLNSLKKERKPAAVSYHIGYLLERIDDVRRIVMRMAVTRKELTELQIKIVNLTPKRITPGKPSSKRLNEVHRKDNRLRKQMRQDMESVYIFGNLLLDQWSYVISYIAGYPVPASDKETSVTKPHLDFFGLLNMLQSNSYKGELSDFWNKHKKDIIWLTFHLRFYRNIFVEHMRKPWQRGTSMASYGDDFNFHIPAPVGFVNSKRRSQVLDEVYKLAPKRLKDMPDDYWEKKNKHRALEVTLYFIDELEKQSDRDKVMQAWSLLGGSTPSYDTIGMRLFGYLYNSCDTILDFIDKYPASINFGMFDERK